jgi:PAS domain S-box-containing protein
MLMHVSLREKPRPTRVVDWLNARLTVIFSLILVAFFVTFTVSWYAFNTQRQLDDQKVLLREDADGILQAMIDQESGLQGYIGTNNAVFLASFQQGRPVYTTYVQNLDTQLQSGPFGHSLVRLATVQEVADEWDSNFALIQINEMQSGNLAGPRSETSILQGNYLFDQLRAAVTALQNAIDQDMQGYQNQVDTINDSLVIGVIIFLLATNAAILWILRHFTGTLQKQLQRLTRTTERLGQGEKTARVDPLAFTDLDQVGQSMNGMADAIQQHQDAMEEAMRTLEHQYTLVERAQSESRAIFDASSEAFLFISTSGKVHAINRPFRDFFGLATEGVVGGAIADLQYQWEPLFVDAASFHADLMQDSLNQERRYTTTLVQKSPQYRELAVSSTPVHSSTGAYLGRLYVLRDSTQEKQAERLKTEFHALVSHGLRAPLTSIKGYTDLLASQEESGPLNELQQEFLGIVQSDTRRMVALVNDLLDLQRLEAQSLLTRTVPLDVHPLIRDVSQSLSRQIEEHHQRLTLDLADAPLVVPGDENRMVQILTNLLTFAMHHTPVGGRINVQTQSTETMVRIICFSSGDLSAEDLDAFNSPFLHSAALSPSGTVGSVLGPSITRSLVELHGGVLQVSSGVGEGCTFICSFPLSSSQASLGEDSSLVHAGDRR